VAGFDTAFHTSIPAAARTYALPSPWRERLPAYGFHGLSHAWASRQAAAQVPGSRRVLVAHLGGGASLCGVLDGRSAVTTMGFTPLDGLVMATRAGSLDPGAVLWLAEHSGADVADLLERRSGLLGLAGTADMREVLARAGAGDADARFALDVYEQRFVLLAGGCAAVLGGVDVVAFTGGVGEHAAGLRDRLVARLAHLGVGGPVPVLVVPAREDLQLAAEARALVG
jgi:acetate kinase